MNELTIVSKVETPLKIQWNEEDFNKFVSYVDEKTRNLVVTKENASEMKTLGANINKIIKSIGSARKETIKEAKKPLESFENSTKAAEKLLETNYRNIKNELDRFDEETKEKNFKLSEAKKMELFAIMNVPEELFEFIKTPEMKGDLSNSSFTLDKAEKVIKANIETELERYNFIKSELAKGNEGVSYKIKFEDIKQYYTEPLHVLSEKLRLKFYQIRKQEEAMKEEVKKEMTKNTHISSTVEEKEVSQTNIPSVKKNAENEKYFDTTIRFENAPLSFLKELKALSDKYNIKFELKESIEL